MAVHPDQHPVAPVDPAMFSRPMPVSSGSLGDVVDPGLVAPRPTAQRAGVDGGARFLAAISYVAGLSTIVYIARPGRRYAFLHSRIALTIHLARLFWVGGVLAVWGVGGANSGAYTLSDLMTDSFMLFIAGVPRIAAAPPDVLPWIVWPIVMTWLASLIGLYLAATGRTIDLQALTRADWNDVVTPWWRRGLTADEERRQARIARQRQLERIQRTMATMGAERTRRERMTEIEEQIQRLAAEQEHINQLLALGEISRRRYDGLTADIQSETATLRDELTDLTSRTAVPRRGASTSPVGRHGRGPECDVETVAIVTPSGIPLFTYGAFQLDEALVAGILSAFDSISEEVFGSRVHKTELAEGKVLHFAHGQNVVVLAIFTDEPSPRQVEQLRTMLRHFEAANAGPLARGQHDPKHLTEVHPPFHVALTASKSGSGDPES